MPRRRPRTEPAPEPTPVPAPTGTVVTVDVPTDGREASAAVIAAIKNVSDGTATAPRVIGFPPGTIGYDPTITLDDRQHVIIDGTGVTFRALTPGDKNRAAWRVRQGADVWFRGATIYGANPGDPKLEARFDHPELEGQHGISFDSVNGGGLLDGNRIYDVFGDFVEARADDRMAQASKLPARNIEIRAGNDFRRAGRHGVGFTWVDGFKIHPGSTMDNVGFAMFDLEVNSADGIGLNIDIAGDYGRHHLAFFAHAGIAGWPRCGNVVIHDVTQTRLVTTCQPILLLLGRDGARKNNIAMRNCRFQGGKDLARVELSDGIVVTDNTLTRTIGGCSNPSPGGILQDATSTVTAARNTIL